MRRLITDQLITDPLARARVEVGWGCFDVVPAPCSPFLEANDLELELDQNQILEKDSTSSIVEKEVRDEAGRG